MANPRCIVCGRAIPKRLTSYNFSLPLPASPGNPGPFGWSGSPAREAGDRRDFGSGIVTLYLDKLPETKADAARLVNGQVVNVRRSRTAPELVEHASVWDGESYRDEYFDTDRCAAQQGRASAHHGARFKWAEN